MNLKFLLPVAACAASASAHALITLEFRPLAQTVNIGSVVTVELWATSPITTGEDFVAVDTILLWDPSIINPISATQSGGAYNSWTSSGFLSNEMNASLSDGNAFWTGLSPLFGTPPAATPSGLKLTSFQFTAVAAGVTTLEMPSIYNWPGRPQPFESKVYGPQNTDLTAALASPATITVVPEPGTLLVLAGGAALLRRRRRRR